MRQIVGHQRRHAQSEHECQSNHRLLAPQVPQILPLGTRNHAHFSIGELPDKRDVHQYVPFWNAFCRFLNVATSI
jgi:hypothetical protein